MFQYLNDFYLTLKLNKKLKFLVIIGFDYTTL